jgi:hypothetical protein
MTSGNPRRAVCGTFYVVARNLAVRPPTTRRPKLDAVGARPLGTVRGTITVSALSVGVLAGECDITYVTSMARGSSGRVVLVVEPELKQELYVELARRGLTLKAWFIDQATRFIETSRQPSLFPNEDIDSRRPQVPSGTPSPVDEDSE